MQNSSNNKNVPRFDIDCLFWYCYCYTATEQIIIYYCYTIIAILLYRTAFVNIFSIPTNQWIGNSQIENFKRITKQESVNSLIYNTIRTLQGMYRKYFSWLMITRKDFELLFTTSQLLCLAKRKFLLLRRKVGSTIMFPFCQPFKEEMWTRFQFSDAEQFQINQTIQ